MTLRERLLAELERLYAELSPQLRAPAGNPCGECRACCTAQGMTYHRVSELELELIERAHGRERVRHFRSYLERQTDAHGHLEHETCPNYAGGCTIHAVRPFSCRLFGHVREAGTRLPEGCVFVGHEQEFARADYFRSVPETARLRRLTREFRVLLPVSRDYVTPGGGGGSLELDYLDPDDAQDRALLHQVQGRWPEALAELLTAHDHEPSAYLDYSLGLVLGSLDRHEEALAAFLRAIPEAPERADLPYYAGYHLLMLGRGEQGRAYLEEAVRLDPVHSLALGFLGYHHLQSGQTATARAYFSRASLADPGNPYFKARLEAL